MESEIINNKVFNSAEESSADTSLSNLMFKKDVKLKTSNIVITIFVMVTVLISIFCTFFQHPKRILTFVYPTNEASEKITGSFIQINIYSFYFFLLLLVGSNFYLFYHIILRRDKNLLRIVYGELKWNFILSQLSTGVIFVIGIFIPKNYASLILSICSNIFNIVNICFYYKLVREKNNLNLNTFTTIYCYNSVMLFFITFLIFCNLGDIMLTGISFENEDSYLFVKVISSITSQTLILLISITLLAYSKDVIFSLTFCYFLIGNLINLSELQIQEIISNFIILFFNIAAVTLTLIKYGKSTFGFNTTEDDDDLISRATIHKKSSWFNSGRN